MTAAETLSLLYPRRVQQWALYASKSDTDGSRSSVRADIINLLRPKSRVLRKTQDQRDPFNTYKVLWGTDTLTPSYIRELIENAVVDLTSVQLTELSPAQREVLALYALTVHPTESPPERFKPHIQLHKFVNRLHNSHAYQTHEDWLESAAMVVQVEGISVQDILKDEAKHKLDRYLAQSVVDEKNKRQLPNFDIDFVAMSDIVIDTVYVNNKRKPLFQNHPTYYDFDTLISHNLDRAPDFIKEHFPFSDHNETRREQTMRDFFKYQYPKMYYGVHNLPKLLAETYAIYMTIHPMTDGNGIMIHSLLDHALNARGYRPIPAWNKTKTEKPLKELRQWIQGDIKPLEHWFERQLILIKNIL